MTSDTDRRLDGWFSAAESVVAKTALAPRLDEIGRVERLADGVAWLSGLANVALDELLLFDGGGLGFVQSLTTDHACCVLLDGGAGVAAGQAARRSHHVVRVPVGEGLLGRVVDPLGRPLDGGNAIAAARQDPIEQPAPAIIERDLVSEPLHTGVLTVDTMFSIGRGQRELIIGDRGSGKSALALDAIIAQRASDVICIYVAVGQKSSSVNHAIETVRKWGTPERCIFVIGGSAELPGLQWIAPFSGFTMAEYFRDQGRSVLIVLDDLSKHAATHREIALLTRESPGREAYPGDVFYLHARLLERAAKLCVQKGGGSITALPIAETDAGNLTGYIPTNLISISDGQLVLDSRLFRAGHKPAIDVGLSVSRVGGKAQAVALRRNCETLRLDYAQFLELELFTRFGGLPDARVRAQLRRGASIRALLIQPQSKPLRLVEEIALMIALRRGLLDTLPRDAVALFRAELAQVLDRRAWKIVAAVQADGTLGNADQNDLEQVLVDWAKSCTETFSSAGAS